MFPNIYCIQLTLLGCKFHWFLFIKNSISWQHRLPCPIGNNQVCSLDLIKPTNFPGNDLSSNYFPFCFTKHGAPKIWISSKFGNFPVWAWYRVILLRLDLVGHLFQIYAAYFLAYPHALSGIWAAFLKNFAISPIVLFAHSTT